MKREEQIRQAALAYSFDTDGGHSGDLNAGRDDFIEGAKWADEHPFLIWHKIADGDLPSEPKGDEFDMPFLVSTHDEDVLFAYYAHKEDEDAPEFYDDCELPLDVEYWAEIPKLPENNK